MQYLCSIIDKREGKFQVRVAADSEMEANDLAAIAAAERGCQHLDEIVVEPIAETNKPQERQPGCFVFA